jgi:hypothetical protein
MYEQGTVWFIFCSLITLCFYKRRGLFALSFFYVYYF